MKVILEKRPNLLIEFFPCFEDNGLLKMIVVKNNQDIIGHLTIENKDSKIYAFDSFVERRFRRIGIATQMYKLAEDLSGKDILPYEYLNPESHSSCDAIEFWRKRGLNLHDQNQLFD